MNSFFADMTLEEVATAEQLAGVAIDEMMDDEKLKGKSLTALVYVFTRRTDPAFTMEDAKKYTVKTAMELIKGKSEDPKAH